MKTIILLIVILIFSADTFSQTACTKEMAYQTVGKWGKQKTDDLAMADRSFPKAQYKPVLAKANKVIDLFMQANPEFKGIEASAKRVIRGDSYLPNGALPFGIDIFYASYFCVPNDTFKVEMRGKVIIFSGYGTTRYISTVSAMSWKVCRLEALF